MHPRFFVIAVMAFLFIASLMFGGIALLHKYCDVHYKCTFSLMGTALAVFAYLKFRQDPGSEDE